MLVVFAAYVVSGFVIVRIVRRFPSIAGRVAAFVASAILSYAVIYALIWTFMYPNFVDVAGESAAGEIVANLGLTYFKFAVGGCLIMSIIAGRRKRGSMAAMQQ